MSPAVASSDSDGEIFVQPQARTQRMRTKLSLLAAAVVFVVAAAALLRGVIPGKSLLSSSTSFEVKSATWQPDFPSQCGKMDVDVEYKDETSGWGTNYDHIPTPEMCCSMCQGVPKCKAFTWVKDAGLEGCPSQCWLKGGTGIPSPATGLVSGVPPATQDVGALTHGPSGDGTSLFCFSLMVPGTDEQKLLEWQHTNQASIFACEGTAVYSSKKLPVAEGVTTVVIDSDLKCEYGGDSQSALNSWIFIALFDKLLHDGEYAKHDWTVKADPDAVFFPDRLRVVVLDHQGAGYINNCAYGMHGPIEVFGKSAMDTLLEDYESSWDKKAPKSCVDGLDFGQWGEDMFLDQCLSKILKVEPRPTDTRLMCEAHCDCPAWYWCTNGTDRVSFHPFKTVDAYEACMGNAMGSGAAILS